MLTIRQNKKYGQFKERLISAIAEAARFSIYYGKYVATSPEERRKITVKHGI